MNLSCFYRWSKLRKLDLYVQLISYKCAAKIKSENLQFSLQMYV